MKKILSIFLVVVLIISVLCGCGKTNTPVNTAEEVVEEAAEPSIKVGLICLHDEQSTYDLNFISAFKEACDAEGVEYLIKTSVPEGQECYEAANELVDSGCNIVFADSFGHEDYMIQAANDNPNVQFCHATGTKAHTEGLSNYHNAFAAIYEGRYLAGVAAGLKLKDLVADGAEPLIGYVGAFSYAEVISGYTAFYLGVKSIVPEVKMKVVFTGSWYDEAMEKEGANSLIDTGCVLLSAHADSMGMPTLCEERGVPFVAYNGSFKNACPNTYIISTKINWAPYYKLVIEGVKNGATIPTDWAGTIINDAVVMTELNESVAAEGTKEALEEVMNQFKANKLKVFDTSTFTVNGEKVESYLADVDTDPNYEYDTEVISDGYFHESEYRAAPYFDMSIDGIELLNAAY